MNLQCKYTHNEEFRLRKENKKLLNAVLNASHSRRKNIRL